MTPEHDRSREVLDAAVKRNPACIGLDRLGGPFTEPERDHLKTCARCQAELALWEEFHASTPLGHEGAAVQWVVAEVQRRRATLVAPSGAAGLLAAFGPRRLGIAAAAAMLAVMVGYLAWDREPRLGDTPVTTEGYRTGQVQVVEPTGDVTEPPDELEWVSVSGAEKYDVAVLEVDRTVLWRGTSSVPRVTLPSSVTARFVHGKTVLWEVSALNRSAAVIAVSGTQRFRVMKRS